MQIISQCLRNPEALARLCYLHIGTLASHMLRKRGANGAARHPRLTCRDLCISFTPSNLVHAASERSGLGANLQPSYF